VIVGRIEPLPADPERPYVPEGAQRSHV